MKPEDAKRFWSKVDIRGPEKCWPWTGATNVDGYGKFSLTGDGQRDRRAHRVAYELSHGMFPRESLVRHTCDNATCCNPAHLALGTTKDNVGDRVARGRSARGEQSGSAKLTETAVADIKARLARGERQTAIASLYGVTQANISWIKKGNGWRHV